MDNNDINNQNPFNAAENSASEAQSPVQPSQNQTPQSDFEQSSPNLGQQAAGIGDPSPNFDSQPTPSFGQPAQPSFEQQPQGFGQPAQPSFEQQPQGFGQPAQSFDTQPQNVYSDAATAQSQTDTWNSQPQQASGGQQSSPYDRWDSNTLNDGNANGTAQQGFGQTAQQGFDQQQNFSQQGQPYNGAAQYGSNEMPVQPEHNLAVAALVLGIASIVFFFGGVSAILSIVCGVVGVILASKAKKAGNTETIRQVGFIMSLVGVVIGAIVFVACVACTGVIGWGFLNS